MNTAVCSLIKLRDKAHNNWSESAQLIEELLVRLNEVMSIFMEEKSQFEIRAEFTKYQLQQKYRGLLAEKEELLRSLKIDLDQAHDEISRLQQRMSEEINQKEQSIQVLKGILKKRIISEVVRERQNKSPTKSKITPSLLLDRKQQRSIVSTFISQGRSSPCHSKVSLNLKEKLSHMDKRKSEETSASSRISSAYGSKKRISRLQSIQMLRPDFI